MTNKKIYQLISFAICPFVQRSVILLKHKKIDHEVTYIDLDNKPDWFLEKVPTGKVPALLIGDDTLFESAVINEFLDETTPPALLPSDPLHRAKERGWINYVEKLIFDQYHMMVATDQDTFEEKRDTFLSGLLKLENVSGQALTNGSTLSLLDASIAPLFTRLKLTTSVYDTLKTKVSEAGNLMNWIDELVQREEVIASVRPSFEDDFKSYFSTRDSYIMNSIG